jgi:hypothetical protein
MEIFGGGRGRIEGDFGREKEESSASIRDIAA